MAMKEKLYLARKLLFKTLFNALRDAKNIHFLSHGRETSNGDQIHYFLIFK